MVAPHLCLASHHHASTVALQIKAGAVLVGLTHQSLDPKETHRGMAVHQHDLYEVRLDPGTVSSPTTSTTSLSKRSSLRLSRLGDNCLAVYQGDVESVGGSWGNGCQGW